MHFFAISFFKLLCGFYTINPLYFLAITCSVISRTQFQVPALLENIILKVDSGRVWDIWKSVPKPRGLQWRFHTILHEALAIIAKLFNIWIKIINVYQNRLKLISISYYKYQNTLKWSEIYWNAVKLILVAIIDIDFILPTYFIKSISILVYFQKFLSFFI